MEDPNTIQEATAMARALMAGDLASFKQGYTAENAALAIESVYGFDAAVILARLNAESASLPEESVRTKPATAGRRVRSDYRQEG